MEIPFLACSTILSLDNKVSSKIVNVSTSSKSGDNMEVHVDNKTIFSIPLSLGWFTLPVFGIDEIPLLLLTTLEFPHVDISVLSINTT